MSAREVMVRAAYGLDVLSLHGCKRHVDNTISALTAAGYVILSPDEVRGIRDEALEEAAETVRKMIPVIPHDGPTLVLVAREIRATLRVLEARDG